VSAHDWWSAEAYGPELAALVQLEELRERGGKVSGLGGLGEPGARERVT